MKYKTITQGHHNYYNHYTILYVSADDYHPNKHQTCVEKEMFTMSSIGLWKWYEL